MLILKCLSCTNYCFIHTLYIPFPADVGSCHPHFFILYVNDLESNVPLYKYVDDSTLFEICNTTDVSVMQESIDRAVNWTNNNCMKINSKNQRKWLFVFLQMKILGILSRALSLMVILLKQWNMQSCLE